MWAKINAIDKLSKILFDEFVYGGHLLSLGAPGIVLSVMVLLNLPFTWPILIIAYLAAQLVYYFDHNKVLEFDATTNPERVKYIKRFKSIFPILLISYAGLLIVLLIVYANLSTTAFIFIISLLGFIYPKTLTKKIIGFKNLYVAFMWAISSAILPYFYYSLPINNLFYFIFSFVMLRWLVNTTFFDLKDIDGDRAEGLKTIPVVYGITKTYKLLAIYNLMSGFILLYAIQTKLVGWSVVCLFGLIIYSFGYLLMAYRADLASIRRISYIMVDGEYLLWPLLMYLGVVLTK